MNEWIVERCSKPFCCKEDAEQYMIDKGFGGLVLELRDGTIQGVCTAYPDGYYKNAKVLGTVKTKAENCC